jgi:hypothetical protein
MERAEAERYSRRELLEMAIACQLSPSDALRGLGRFSTDVGVDLAIITSEDIRHLLRLFIEGERNASEIQAWAEFIDFRDDVGFENDRVIDVVAYLANPEMNGPVTPSAANDLLTDLHG